MMYWVYRLAAWLLPRTHDAIGYPVFDLIGTLAYRCAGRVRGLVAANMRHVLGPAPDERAVQRATHEAFRHLAMNYYDLFHLPGFSQHALRQRMDLVGIERIDKALGGGKGVLLAGVHFGNTEYLMQVPSLFPHFHFTLLVEKLADARSFELMRRMRASIGMNMVAVDEPLKMVRSLRQNHVVGIAFDRDVTHSGIPVEFFGQTAIIADGVIRLAMRTGAPVIPTYGWREGQRFRVRVLPALELVSTGDQEADVRANLRRLLAVFEPIIRERPGQWMAFHKVWADD
ncbi:MAG: lysophospholipid acyltransferase family protein [Chloroflexota bacterium]